MPFSCAPVRGRSVGIADEGGLDIADEGGSGNGKSLLLRPNSLFREGGACMPMLPTLTWDDSISFLYSGREKRGEFARGQILPVIDEIANKIEGKRNLKSEFFEGFIHDP